MLTIKNFLNTEGNISSSKSTEKYVKKHFPDEYIKIIDKAISLNIKDRKFSEKIYHYINNLDKPIHCLNCGVKIPTFRGLSNGYLNFCSSKCSNSSKLTQDKKEKSYINKYGVNNPSKAQEIKDKIKNTFEENYGGNPFELNEFKEKIKQTNLEKYGAEYIFSKNSKIIKNKEEKYISDFIKKYKDLDIIEYNIGKYKDVKIKCKKCGNVFEISKWNLHQRTKLNIENICTICNPIGYTKNSYIEKFIENLLNEYNIYYIKNDRNLLDNKEIDFLLSNFNIGIEVNGLYWHSEIFKDKKYHSDKNILATKKGINLISIFEDEILHKEELVKGRIKSILGIYDKRIYARKCDIKEIDSNTANNFLDKNHMQQKCGSTFRYGLFFNNELISIMTFGKNRKNLGRSHKEGEYELIRFCNKLNYNVIGGASKLLKYFIKNIKPKKIISYCDLRWSNGNFYEKIGFKKNSITNPNYFYINTTLRIRENRFKYRKDVLIKEGFDKNKSESEIMRGRDFIRIYDCGSIRFEMEL